MLEARLDSPFFSDEIIRELGQAGAKFTVSVPFERFGELKKMIEAHRKWKALDETWSYFENGCKPKACEHKYRFVFIRRRSKLIDKKPVQLKLFVPHQHGYEFKVMVTNKGVSAKKVLLLHNGRGSQESVLGELKSHSRMEYVAVRRLYGNQPCMTAAIPADRGTTSKRAPLWKFIELATLRHRLIQRAGRLTNPSGCLTLTLGANEAVRNELLRFLERPDKAP